MTTMAHVSEKEKASAVAQDVELFSPELVTRDCALDPSSEHFSMASWFEAIQNLKRTSHPPKPFSLTFRNLSAHGETTQTHRQPTFGTHPIHLLRKLLPTRAIGRKRVDILRSIDGLVEQKEMLLVLGRPGSGCTTLLKTLTGESRGFEVGSDSYINYRGEAVVLTDITAHAHPRTGIPPITMHTEFRGDCVYTAELDVHFPELTVQQTLDFAVQTRLPRTPLPGLTRSQQAIWFREALLTMLGLRSARHTKLGNDLIRGVSGGERKRVSLAEAMSCWSAFHCWDNSTRGLDSSTALAFVRMIRESTTTRESTAIMTMYQASNAIYETFDKVTVLYQGHQIFFGQCDEAVAYFTDMGFQRPHNATIPDFLTSLTHPAEAKLLVRPGCEHTIPMTADEFRQAWLESPQRQTLVQQMQKYDTRYPINSSDVNVYRQSKLAGKTTL